MPARQHRVTRGDDYRRIVRSGYRVGGALCIAHAVLRCSGGASAEVEAGRGAPSTDAARFGFIISKAVGGAVVRNRVRRRLKYIVEQRLRDGYSGVDVVFRALPAIAGAEFSEIDREVNRQLDRIDDRLRQGSGAARSTEGCAPEIVRGSFENPCR